MNASTNSLLTLLNLAVQLNSHPKRDQIITDSGIDADLAKWLLTTAVATLHHKPVSVAVGLIHHRHGADWLVATTEDVALEAVNHYVNEWWDDISDEDGSNPAKPDDPDEARDLYFNLRTDEDWEIGSAELR